jgi:hypothetical protein
VKSVTGVQQAAIFIVLSGWLPEREDPTGSCSREKQRAHGAFGYEWVYTDRTRTFQQMEQSRSVGQSICLGAQTTLGL